MERSKSWFIESESIFRFTPFAEFLTEAGKYIYWYLVPAIVIAFLSILPEYSLIKNRLQQ